MTAVFAPPPPLDVQTEPGERLTLNVPVVELERLDNEDLENEIADIDSQLQDLEFRRSRLEDKRYAAEKARRLPGETVTVVIDRPTPWNDPELARIHGRTKEARGDVAKLAALNRAYEFRVKELLEARTTAALRQRGLA